MPDILSESNAWLEGQRHSYLSSCVTFRRGIDSVSIDATLDKTDYQVESSDGQFLSIRTIDFVVRTEDLGALSTPIAGDKIQRTLGGKVLTYETYSPMGEDLFEHDSYRTSIRIHTKLVSEVDA